MLGTLVQFYSHDQLFHFWMLELLTILEFQFKNVYLKC